MCIDLDVDVILMSPNGIRDPETGLVYVELDVSTLPVACDRCFIRGPPNTW